MALSELTLSTSTSFMGLSAGITSQIWQLAPTMVRKPIWAKTSESALSITRAHLQTLPAGRERRLAILQNHQCNLVCGLMKYVQQIGRANPWYLLLCKVPSGFENSNM